MSCTVQTENPDILLDYCSRRLNPDLMEVLEQHLSVCPDCRSIASAQQALWTALESWDSETVSSDFNRRLYRRIENRPGLLQRFAGWFEWKPSVPLAAAGLAALVLVLSVPDASGPPHSSPAARPRSTEVLLEPEQVERALEDLEMLKQLGGLAPSSRHSL